MSLHDLIVRTPVGLLFAISHRHGGDHAENDQHLWQIAFDVTKRRAGRAPEGSGVPVGTDYHWYIVAHQNTRKVNANDYETSMTGLKFKIAHKRAGSDKWSATPKTQRKRMIKFLQDVIADLERAALLETPAKPAPRKAPRRKLAPPPSMMKRASRSRRGNRRTR